MIQMTGRLLSLCLLISPLFFGCSTADLGIPRVLPPTVTSRKPKRQDAGSVVQKFASSHTCANCHGHIYAQQNVSMHALSYSNEVFRAQYFGEILPAAGDSPAMHKEARSCGACHMPVAYLKGGRRIVTAKDVDASMSGVTCDLCHRIDGYEGRRPGNGNFTAVPGSTKYGPFRHKRAWHHAYLKLQTKSEFCATCHHAVNHRGVLVKPTYAEWKKSKYAKKGIECQDCHMNANGYLIDAKASFESGKAATMVLGSAPERRKLYSHNFPGAHTGTQLANAIPVRMKLSVDSNALNNAIAVMLEVDNVRTGHSMPSGSIEIRYLWLDVCVFSGTNKFELTASSSDGSRGYDLSCKVPGDRVILGPGFPAGKRIYRAVLHDKAGKQTDSMVDAADKVFDNRLKAESIRKEEYTWRVPKGFKGDATVVATLYYVAYPHSFSKRLHLSAAKNTAIACVRRLARIAPSGEILLPPR
jgi:hypothetical protein